jgi:nucleoside-diphosphate-sugar epimerase
MEIIRDEASGGCGMKVFLTGASGFIGTSVLHALFKAGHDVVCHSLSTDGPFSTLPEKIDVVVNTAGRLGGGTASKDELNQANCVLPMKLAAECLEHGACMIHLSTPGVCGLRPNAMEDDPFDPMGDYEVTKAEGEKMVKGILPDATILRPDFVFGEGDMHKYPLFRKLAGGWFPLVGSGGAKTRPTDVLDVTEAVLASFPGGCLHGNTYNIGGPELLSIRDLALVTASVMGSRVRLLPVPRWVYRALLKAGPLCPKALSESRFRLFGTDRYTNTDKARSAGFSPVHSFGETAARAARWYRERGLI